MRSLEIRCEEETSFERPSVETIFDFLTVRDCLCTSESKLVVADGSFNSYFSVSYLKLCLLFISVKLLLVLISNSSLGEVIEELVPISEGLVG